MVSDIIVVSDSLCNYLCAKARVAAAPGRITQFEEKGGGA